MNSILSFTGRVPSPTVPNKNSVFFPFSETSSQHQQQSTSQNGFLQLPAKFDHYSKVPQTSKLQISATNTGSTMSQQDFEQSHTPTPLKKLLRSCESPNSSTSATTATETSSSSSSSFSGSSSTFDPNSPAVVTPISKLLTSLLDSPASLSMPATATAAALNNSTNSFFDDVSLDLVDPAVDLVKGNFFWTLETVGRHAAASSAQMPRILPNFTTMSNASADDDNKNGLGSKRAQDFTNMLIETVNQIDGSVTGFEAFHNMQEQQQQQQQQQQQHQNYFHHQQQKQNFNSVRYQISNFEHSTQIQPLIQQLSQQQPYQQNQQQQQRYQQQQLQLQHQQFQQQPQHQHQQHQRQHQLQQQQQQQQQQPQYHLQSRPLSGVFLFKQLARTTTTKPTISSPLVANTSRGSSYIAPSPSATSVVANSPQNFTDYQQQQEPNQDDSSRQDASIPAANSDGTDAINSRHFLPKTRSSSTGGGGVGSNNVKLGPESLRCRVQECRKAFKRHDTLMSHMKVAHKIEICSIERDENGGGVGSGGSGSIVCVCGAVFGDGDALDTHIKRTGHVFGDRGGGEGDEDVDVKLALKCPNCDQTFSRNHDLKRHMFTHTTARPFSCQRCGKGFARKDVLRKHEEAFESGKKVNCVPKTLSIDTSKVVDTGNSRHNSEGQQLEQHSDAKNQRKRKFEE
ncbi:Zinc finger and BTB domain-containing protein 8A [Physocladia obscura]|uniref:Zinc finger and BTB domain-containing protein 8A n=1 Tax=Physocladia obscura TaxID=109957 RepID=A0AAD5SPK3_9FUNG|nr:Zinc finger and BTB domain-containing protein 8A [Physocladia obscura]